MSEKIVNLKLKLFAIEKGGGQQTVFCQKVGIREDTLSALIHGRKSLTESLIKRIELTCGCNRSEFIEDCSLEG